MDYDQFVSKSKSPDKKTGEIVRKMYEQIPFDREFYPKWTDTTYEIDKTSKDTIPMYKIKNEKNKQDKQRYYSSQIQTIIPDRYRIEKVIKERKSKGKTQCFVKWLNYPTEYNSWVYKSDIQKL